MKVYDICSDGQKYSGTFTIKTLRVFDELDYSLSYKHHNCDESHVGTEYVFFHSPFNQPGEIVPEPCDRFFGKNEKKDQKVRDEFKELFVKKCQEAMPSDDLK